MIVTLALTSKCSVIETGFSEFLEFFYTHDYSCVLSLLLSTHHVLNTGLSTEKDKSAGPRE